MTRQTSLKQESRLRRNGAVLRERARPQVNGSRGRQVRKPSRRVGAARLVGPPSLHSEETRTALLQCGAGRQVDRMTVAYHTPNVEVDLSAGGKTILSGAFESELLIDGVPQLPCGDWMSVCWHGDDDGEYLELQLCLSDSVRIDRQLLLSRRGRFAFVADAVVASQAARIEYRLSLPAADGVQMKFDSSTREARLRAAGCAVRVFPLALPQDRVLSTAGNCCERNGRLELTQVGRGQGLFVPVVFDWDPHRRSATADWRSLTVTEFGKAVGADRAAGHRLRLGKLQLLIYRSLADTDEARAVLGHHTRYETIVGMFDPAGNVAPIVMVEKE